MHHLIIPYPMQTVLEKCFGHVDNTSSKLCKKYSLVTQIVYMPHTEVKIYHPTKIGRPFLGEWVSKIRVVKLRSWWCWEISTTKKKGDILDTSFEQMEAQIPWDY